MNPEQLKCDIVSAMDQASAVVLLLDRLRAAVDKIPTERGPAYNLYVNTHWDDIEAKASAVDRMAIRLGRTTDLIAALGE